MQDTEQITRRAHMPFSYLIFFFFFTIFYLSSLQAIQEFDRIHGLPGQPQTPQISQFSGYITVNKENGRALFYWFFEAQTLPSKRPLLLWLNGGPGCSSVGYGAAVELGPLKVKRNGTGLEYNKYAWNKEANLLFLESPIGVGFSYTNTSSDLAKLDDGFVAEDAYSFMVNWLKRFPQYQARDFYISGESYAGHYVPQLSELIYERNKNTKNYPFINFKGFMVGNPETDDYFDSKGLVEYAWSHTVISDQIYERVNKDCDFKLFNNWTSKCIQVMDMVFDRYRDIDIYNVYAPKCNNAHPSSSLYSKKQRLLQRTRTPAGYDPCYSVYAEEYFNRVDVQRAMHASVINNGKWKVCNESILDIYNNTVSSVLPIYSKLIKAGLRIWIYSGDADGRVPVIGSRYCVESLDLLLKTQWQSWYHNHQVGGRFVEYQGLTMVTVRGAGHLVPLNKPSEALVLINTFLGGHKLLTNKWK
ncbi:serine carboxypeptidase-like 26 isoform X2 [Dioscorea cayenensis subsp. rotundata]|uniref:Carboxypeptidase n=1 Tax=Dioscorea cayennensis subsp. rotundata TaxID=55577 RepID=A0AB40D826_DIOCR|nr:serine carboxypeptidase-like 26 isoform X2 [Dioscorea cayenensis subsp. rotundata]